ncbi:MAG: hypothetical protein NUW06_01185 [Candidatus Acetothermia bacterium]|nr:hypothetical protein [Candidatus Acetothermia bacterium]
MYLYERQAKITTQIGSLPFHEVKAAVAYSLEHDIPFLPELVARGEAMLEYIKKPGSLSCLAEFKRHRFETVKVQVIGPATLIQSGYEGGEALARIYEHILGILEGLEAEEVILFLDEPALGYAGFDYERLWEALFASLPRPVIRGVHVCGNMEWDRLFDAEIEIISFDASRYDITRYYESRKGKRLAWGITQPEQIKDFRKGDLITPPCGLPPRAFTEERAGEILALLRRAAELYRVM